MNITDRLIQLAGAYHHEARRCARGKAYLGASVMQVAALEAGLQAMCFLFPKEVKRTTVYANKRFRGRRKKALEFSLNQVINIADELGWFPSKRITWAGKRTTLVWPGTTLDHLWTLNPRAYKELAPHTKAVGIPFLLLGVILAAAGMGWFKRRLWGWQLAVGIIAVQVLGDLVNAFMGDLVRGGVGFVIAGALLVYLLRPEVRAAFASGNAPSLR